MEGYMSNLDDNWIAERDHYDGLKEELGYETVFDLDLKGCKPLDFKILHERPSYMLALIMFI